MLCEDIKIAAKKAIVQMVQTQVREMKIPNTPLTVIKTGPDFKLEKNYFPISVIGEYLVVQKGL